MADRDDRAARMARALSALADEMDPDGDEPAPRWGARSIAMKIRAAVREALTVPAGEPQNLAVRLGQDAYPLTCEWCRHAPATHLVITDVQPTGRQSADRHKAEICAECAHRVNALPESYVGFWLYRLEPDHCEES